MRFVPGSLAMVAPEWLLAHSDADWTLRYGHRIEESRLPTLEGDRLALAEVMGADGWKVLTAVFDPLAPCLFARNPCGAGLAPDLGPKLLDGGRAPAMARSRHYSSCHAGASTHRTRLEAHLGKKRSTLWTGDIH